MKDLMTRYQNLSNLFHQTQSMLVEFPEKKAYLTSKLSEVEVAMEAAYEALCEAQTKASQEIFGDTGTRCTSVALVGDLNGAWAVHTTWTGEQV